MRVDSLLIVFSSGELSFTHNCSLAGSFVYEMSRKAGFGLAIASLIAAGDDFSFPSYLSRRRCAIKKLKLRG